MELTHDETNFHYAVYINQVQLELACFCFPFGVQKRGKNKKNRKENFPTLRQNPFYPLLITWGILPYFILFVKFFYSF